jgi:hypothetical protein
VRGKLYGSASYTMTIDIRHDRAARFTFAGSARVFYSESFKRGSATSFVEEDAFRWNQPVSLALDIDTATGRACFRWGEPGEFATIVWGTC